MKCSYLFVKGLKFLVWMMYIISNKYNMLIWSLECQFVAGTSRTTSSMLLHSSDEQQHRDSFRSYVAVYDSQIAVRYFIYECELSCSYCHISCYTRYRTKHSINVMREETLSINPARCTIFPLSCLLDIARSLIQNLQCVANYHK